MRLIVISLIVFAALLPIGIQSASADGDCGDYNSVWVEELEMTTVIQNRRPTAIGMADSRFVADDRRLYIWLDLYVEDADDIDVEVNLENVETGERLTLTVPGPADSEFDRGEYPVWVELELTADRVGHWKVSALAEGDLDTESRAAFVVTALPEPPVEVNSEANDVSVDAVDDTSLWVQFLRS